jgi:hypothetical protein
MLGAVRHHDSSQTPEPEVPPGAAAAAATVWPSIAGLNTEEPLAEAPMLAGLKIAEPPAELDDTLLKC